MATLISGFQDRVKTSSNALSLWIFKTISGLIVGLTLGLIGDQIIDYGTFSLLLVMVVTTATCLRIMKSWSWMHVFVFNLICVLIGLLLRMYIEIAPG